MFKFCSAYNFHFIICEISGILTGLPGGSVDKEFTCRCKKHRFDPWVRKISWRRAWKPTPVFLPGESHRGAWQDIVLGFAKSRTQLK